MTHVESLEPGDLVISHLPTEMHPEESTIITISLRTVKAMPSAVVHKKIADRCGCSSPLKYCSGDFDPAKKGSKLEGWNGLRTWVYLIPMCLKKWWISILPIYDHVRIYDHVSGE